MSKRVLITGANGLIGRALIKTFLENSWDVLAHSRQPFDSNAKNLVLDLSPAGSGKKLIDLAGNVDCVINNAANQEVVSVEKLTPSDIEQIFRINTAAPIEITIAAKAVGAQVVINISSIEAITPQIGRAHV